MSSPTVIIKTSGATGRSYADLLRATGAYGVLPADTDLQAVTRPAEVTLALAGGAANYRTTRAQGVTDFAVGQYFSSAETGELRIYKRISGSPFYQDEGDAAAPVTKSKLAATTGAALVGASSGGTVQAVLDSLLAKKMPVYPLDAYGADPTGVSFSDAAFTAVLTAIGKTGADVSGQGTILLGPGTYKFSAQLVASMSQTTRNSFVLRGMGPNVSHMLWPNVSAGIAITVKGQENAVQISDLSLLTSRAGGGTALSITNSGAFGGGDGNSSNIERVYFAGDDKTTLHDSALHYWTDCVITTCHSNINYFGCSFEGNTPTGNGTGVTFQGNAGTSTYAVVCNFTACQFNNLTKGFIYGTWAQGVTFSQCNFTSGDYGIWEAGTTFGTAQLTVIGSQFAINKDHITVNGCTQVSVIGNTHYIHYANQSAFAVFRGLQIAFQGNHVVGPSTVMATTNGVYIYDNFPNHTGIISGNTFYHLAKGVWLDTLSNGWNCYGNSYSGCTANTTNTGTGNSVGVATA